MEVNYMRWGHIVPPGSVELCLIIQTIIWLESMVSPVVASIVYHWRVSARSVKPILG